MHNMVVIIRCVVNLIACYFLDERGVSPQLCDEMWRTVSTEMQKDLQNLQQSGKKHDLKIWEITFNGWKADGFKFTHISLGVIPSYVKWCWTIIVWYVYTLICYSL